MQLHRSACSLSSSYTRVQVLQLVNKPAAAAAASSATRKSSCAALLGLGELTLSYSATSQTKDENSTINENEWGEFLHLPGKKIYDYNEVRRCAWRR